MLARFRAWWSAPEPRSIHDGGYGDPTSRGFTLVFISILLLAFPLYALFLGVTGGNWLLIVIGTFWASIGVIAFYGVATKK